MAVDPTTPALYGALYGSALYGTIDAPVPFPSGTLTTDAPRYEGDPLFFETGDGGDVQINQGEHLRSGGLRNAVYLSLFGANVEDTGLPGDRKQWWGNLTTRDEAQQYRGQTQRTLETLPMVSANIPLLEAIAESDLAWLLDKGVATSVAATATITGPKRVKLSIDIEVEGERETFEFYSNWAARS